MLSSAHFVKQGLGGYIFLIVLLAGSLSGGPLLLKHNRRVGQFVYDNAGFRYPGRKNRLAQPNRRGRYPVVTLMGVGLLLFSLVCAVSILGSLLLD